MFTGGTIRVLTHGHMVVVGKHVTFLHIVV